EETRVHLEKLGIDPSKITVSGIPVDPVFAVKRDKAEMREKHGLARGPVTILVSAGGFGVGPMENMLTSLMALRHPAQVIAICGRNEQLKKKMEKLVAS